MKLLLSIFTTLVCAAVMFAADVTGKWTGTVETPNGTRDVTMNLKADGSNLTGTVSGRNGDTEIKDGKINGDDISFTVIRNFNGNEIKQNYTGKVRVTSFEKPHARLSKNAAQPQHFLIIGSESRHALSKLTKKSCSRVAKMPL